ncbi:NifB/NifX family molybdenum-iron cluster-binding protein [Methanolobus sp. ZRKC3]|uniref:NifB/NifX family molybdenum-iron cluster-binding protein n=1 Tax=Methanolobus sp. ZRKC3 TaxID=3125786 RepID=UPI00325350DE
MKVSVPSMGSSGLEDTVCQHFGTSPYYTVFDTETEAVVVIENTSDHKGGVGHPPELISKAGVNVMLCGGLGKKAVQMLQELGIDVFVGASGSVKDTIDAWQSEKLAPATKDTDCSSHSHGDVNHTCGSH